MYYLYNNKDNKINVHFFNSESDRLNFIEEKNCKEYVIADKPKDMYFFEAFEWDGSINNIKINIQKAKEIKLNHFRLIRSIILPKLDILYIKGLESSDLELQKQIIDDKNYLRNITQIELPDNEIELLNFLPPRLVALYSS